MDRDISLYDANSQFGKTGPALKVTEDMVSGNQSRHSHTFYEFVYIKSGYGYHLCQNTADFLIPGSIVALSAGIAHSFVNNCSLNMVSCSFTSETLDALGRPLKSLDGLKRYFIDPGKYTYVNCSNEQGERIYNYLKSIETEFAEKNEGWESMACSMLSGVLIELARIFSGKKSPKSARVHYLPYIGQVLDYIHENYKENIDSENIANHLGLSADYLTRLFKKATGVSPVEYLRNYRMSKAITLLQQTDDDISDISVSVGIPDLSVFSRLFKSIMGVSPSTARKASIGSSTGRAH